MKTEYVKSADLDSLSENILSSVDYDIYKEDLEEREIIGSIKQELEAFLGSYEIPLEGADTEEEG